MANDTSSSLSDRIWRRVGFVSAFLTANARPIVVDAIVIVSWVGLLSLAFGRFGWSTWVYILVLVAGIVGYTLSRKPLVFPE